MIIGEKMSYKWKLVTLGDVLLHFEQYPDGWLYLPPDCDQWTLQTKGVFSLDSKDFPADSDEDIPPQAKTDGWVETLGSDLIDQIIYIHSALIYCA